MASSLQKAVVRSLPGEPNMTITLTVGGKQRNMDRPKDELLEKPLGRLQKSAAPQPDKQQRRAKGKAAADAAARAPPPPPPVTLHAGPSAEHPALDAAAVTNEEAWRHGRLLRVGSAAYRVDLNPPLLDRLEVHGTPFVGIPLVPAMQAHFTEEQACRWRWLRAAPGEREVAPIPGATSRRYVPRPEDAGCRLRVECTPGRRLTREEAAGGEGSDGVELGEAGAAECGPVAVPPSPGASAARHALTRQPTAPPQLRVVTYNILADQYAATEAAKNVIFAHCPPQYLDPAYRRPLVLAELLGFHADVLCLQEVDEKMFSACLTPQLEQEGFRGVYTNKAGKPGLSVREGSATFFRASRFALAAHRSLTLKELFPAQPGDEAKYGSVFEPMLRSSPALQHALQRIATVAQLSLLAPLQPGDAPLCVLNTHLFYHYQAPHIRTMHVWAMLQEARQFIDEAVADPQLAARLGGQRPALLFCGDLNSDLNDGIPGAIELLGKGRLPADFWDWFFGAEFKWEKGEEAAAQASEAPGGSAAAQQGAGEGAHADQPGSPSQRGGSTLAGAARGQQDGVQPPRQQQEEEKQQQGGFVAGVELCSPFVLRAADGLRTPFTNHVKGYQGLLDYVWFEAGAMEVAREVPPPPLADLGGYLPNSRHPSDHLPVVFDLRFTARADAAAGDARGGAAGSGGNGAAGSSSSTPGGGGSDGAAGSGGGGSRRPPHVLPAALYNAGLAAEALGRGEVLALPTDTLYGLGACAGSSRGVAHIYATKRRGDHKPLAIAVADVSDVARFAEVEDLPPGLLADLLPGPVTLLLRRRPDAPLAPELNPGVAAIGVRIPDAPFIRAVCRQHRAALALTSANLSGGLSSVEVEEFEELWPACSLVFDGGRLDAGRSGSTVVDLTQPGRFAIARRGSGFARTVQLLTEKYGLVHDLG